MSSQHSGFTFRLLFLIAALIIISASTLFSNRLAKDLSQEEQKKIELWAEAIRVLAQEDNNEDVHFDYSLVLKIIEENTNIPVILTDENDSLLSYSNLRLSRKNPENDLKQRLESMKEEGRVIEIKLSDTISQQVYYDDSKYLKELKYFPFIQLFVMFIFLAVTIIALSISKRAEQNRVWVGLSKETAHQLGTPISSLLAWEELLKLKDIDPNLLSEIEKDTKRLETIAERFSKIGSKPEPKPEMLTPAIQNSVNYIKGRSSKKVQITTHLPEENLLVYLNIPLFEWVIENLCKNAIDAMNGDGKIDIYVTEEKKNICIDVKDTGKGIPKNHFKNIFKPGFTTKARGWGLGLSLVKRIIEEYHQGKIFVKSSEIGKGTTFRILLKKAEQ